MNRKVLTSSLFLLCIMGFAVFLTACSRNCFVGSRTVEAGFYQLDIDCMTGIDRFTMELSAGDMLAVQFETVKGLFTWRLRNRMKAPYMLVTARA